MADSEYTQLLNDEAQLRADANLVAALVRGISQRLDANAEKLLALVEENNELKKRIEQYEMGECDHGMD